MKKILVFLALFAIIANATSTKPSENEEYAVRTYIKSIDNFNIKYVKLIERTSKEGVFAVHISAGLNIAHTFYVMPKVGFHSYTMIESPKLKDMPYKAMTPREFRKKVFDEYMMAVNDEQTKKDIFSLASPSKDDTEITVYMFADDKCVTCRNAYDFLSDKVLTYKKIHINKAGKEKEFIKSAYNGDIGKYKQSKFLANKLQVLTPPVFLIYSNHEKKFIDVFPYFDKNTKEYLQEASNYNSKVLSFKEEG